MRPVVAALLLLLAVPAWAQEPAKEPPALPPLDAARLQILELAIENLSLKLDALKREAETFLRTLQHPGYELRKENGQWGYRPMPAPEPPPKEPPDGR